MKLDKCTTPIPDLTVLEPNVYEDNRGFFYESYNLSDFKKLLKIDKSFIQDNHSLSHNNVLRGLHYQIIKPQGKLVRVIKGEIYDVAVDLRKSSEYFGNWYGIYLSAENKKQLWIPEGFAHGFLVTSAIAEVVYKTTEYRYQEHERTILWNDPEIDIKWPKIDNLIISEKDKNAKYLKENEIFEQF